MPLKDYTTGTTNKILIGTGGIGLIITAIVGLSGRTPAYQTRDSSGQNTWGVSIDGTTTQSGSIATKNLISCNTIDTTSTGMLVCGSDATGAGSQGTFVNTGALASQFDNRYVNTSGDTMTGSLNIDLTTGARGLNVVETASGAHLHAEKELTNSGTFVNEGTGLFNGILSMNSLLSFVGYSSSPQLTAADTTTGVHFDGPGIVSIHNGGTQTMLLSSTNKVGIGDGAPTEKLEVVGSISGSVLYGNNALRSSGTLVVEGAMSGSSLYIGTSLNGAGLADCDAATQTLSWDATTGRFGCGTDADTTYTAGQGLTLTSTSLSLSATHSGTVIKAVTSLSSSGTIVVEGNISGATLDIGNAIRGGSLVILSGNSSILGNISFGSAATPKTTVEVYGTLSGSLIRGTTLSGNTVKTGRISASPTTTEIIPFGTGTSLTTGSGKILYVIPKTMSGFKIYDVGFYVATAGVTNATKLQIRNIRANCKIFNTPPQIDSATLSSDVSGTPFVINASCNTVQGGDYLYADIPNISTTAPKGANYILYLYNP